MSVDPELISQIVNDALFGEETDEEDDLLDEEETDLTELFDDEKCEN